MPMGDRLSSSGQRIRLVAQSADAEVTQGPAATVLQRFRDIWRHDCTLDLHGLSGVLTTLGS